MNESQGEEENGSEEEKQLVDCTLASRDETIIFSSLSSEWKSTIPIWV